MPRLLCHCYAVLSYAVLCHDVLCYAMLCYATKVLQLTFNRGLAGPLPEGIGALSRLERLYAWNASLERIPDTIGNLSRLVAIDLTDNRLRGPLPTSLARLARADTVYFDGNAGLRCPLAPPVRAWLASVNYSADPCAARARL